MGWASCALLLSVVTALPQAASAKGYADLAKPTAKSHVRTVSTKKTSPTKATAVRRSERRGAWNKGWAGTSSGNKYSRYMRHASGPKFSGTKFSAANRKPSLNNQFAHRHHGYNGHHGSRPAGMTTPSTPSQPSTTPSAKTS
ncbi:MAG: hypothetical protein C0483_04920 [Pirellula sp.]|nr:hypothetical protein [Pirellula sp.]